MNGMTFYSQAAQDKFVYGVLYGLLDKQDQGYYLEIGAGEPIYINNTYFFEKNLQWKGTSVDISLNLVQSWDLERNNLLLIEDATKADYEAILDSFPEVIDYLSLDIDDFYTEVLERIPFNNHIFKIITIEHDAYRYGDLHRDKERQFLSAQGYYMLCSNVNNFEDWWIHPSAFPSSVFSALESLDMDEKHHSQLTQILQDIIRQGAEN